MPAIMRIRARGRTRLTNGLRRVGVTTDILGEGPVWDVAEQALYWVDIRGQAIRRLDGSSGTVQTWTMPDLISCLALREGGGLIVALRTQVAFWTPERGLEPLAPHGGHEAMRFNDGRCD